MKHEPKMIPNPLYCDKCDGRGYLVADAEWEPYAVQCDACAGRRPARPKGSLMDLELQIYEALREGAVAVCDLKCPSVWKTGDLQPHSKKCKEVHAALSAWIDHCSYADLIASGGFANDGHMTLAPRSDGAA
jgi:hypothetical protein